MLSCLPAGLDRPAQQSAAGWAGTTQHHHGGEAQHDRGQVPLHGTGFDGQARARVAAAAGLVGCLCTPAARAAPLPAAACARGTFKRDSSSRSALCSAEAAKRKAYANMYMNSSGGWRGLW